MLIYDEIQNLKAKRDRVEIGQLCKLLFAMDTAHYITLNILQCLFEISVPVCVCVPVCGISSLV